MIFFCRLTRGRIPTTKRAAKNNNTPSARSARLNRLFRRRSPPSSCGASAGRDCGSSGPEGLVVGSSESIAASPCSLVQTCRQSSFEQRRIFRRKSSRRIPMQEAVEDRHEKKRAKGGEQQTADNRSAERSVLFSSLSQTERHR